MQPKKKVLSVIATLSALTALLGLTWNGASGTSANGASPDKPNRAGVGETLLLVVADVVPVQQAESRLQQINAAFGDLQGFYPDATDGYKVLGALLQTSPDLVTAVCPPMVDGDCEVGEVTKTLQPVSTALVNASNLHRPDTAELCARSGNSCGLSRAMQILGEDLELDPGSVLVTTAFRTKRGAEEFLEFARAAGLTGLVTLHVRKLAGGDVGLGQEPSPDGTGPLRGPLFDQLRYQR